MRWIRRSWELSASRRSPARALSCRQRRRGSSSASSELAQRFLGSVPHFGGEVAQAGGATPVAELDPRFSEPVGEDGEHITRISDSSSIPGCSDPFGFAVVELDCRRQS